MSCFLIFFISVFNVTFLFASAGLPAIQSDGFVQFLGTPKISLFKTLNDYEEKIAQDKKKYEYAQVRSAQDAHSIGRIERVQKLMCASVCSKVKSPCFSDEVDIENMPVELSPRAYAQWMMLHNPYAHHTLALALDSKRAEQKLKSRYRLKKQLRSKNSKKSWDIIEAVNNRFILNRESVFPGSNWKYIESRENGFEISDNRKWLINNGNHGVGVCTLISADNPEFQRAFDSHGSFIGNQWVKIIGYGPSKDCFVFQSLENEKAIKGPFYGVNAFVSRDCKWAAAKSDHGQLYLQSFESDKIRHNLGDVSFAQFSNNSRWFTYESGSQTKLIQLIGNDSFIEKGSWLGSAAFSSDSKWLLFSGLSGAPAVLISLGADGAVKVKRRWEKAYARFSENNKWVVLNYFYYFDEHTQSLEHAASLLSLEKEDLMKGPFNEKRNRARHYEWSVLDDERLMAIGFGVNSIFWTIFSLKFEGKSKGPFELSIASRDYKWLERKTKDNNGNNQIILMSLTFDDQDKGPWPGDCTQFGSTSEWVAIRSDNAQGESQITMRSLKNDVVLGPWPGYKCDFSSYDEKRVLVYSKDSSNNYWATLRSLESSGTLEKRFRGSQYMNCGFSSDGKWLALSLHSDYVTYNTQLFHIPSRRVAARIPGNILQFLGNSFLVLCSERKCKIYYLNDIETLTINFNMLQKSFIKLIASGRVMSVIQSQLKSLFKKPNIRKLIVEAQLNETQRIPELSNQYTQDILKEFLSGPVIKLHAQQSETEIVEQKKETEINDAINKLKQQEETRDSDKEFLFDAIKSDDDAIAIMPYLTLYTINSRDKNYHTPLMKAAICGHKNIVRKLIYCKGYAQRTRYHLEEFKADLQAIDGDGDTALHLAIINKHFEIVVMLAEKMPPHALCIKNKSGKTPYALAQDLAEGYKGNNDFDRLLLRLKN